MNARKNLCIRSYVSVALLLLGLYSQQPKILYAENLGKLHHMIGDQDAVLLADARGRVLFSENAAKKLIPASTLKILTALVALHFLGPDFRFQTEFYLDRNANLKIKGYGDPLLISEVLEKISRTLKQRLGAVNDIILDATYFENPLTVPGVSDSSEPYDAPNGALCVNFNTVYFKRTDAGTYISAEPQTPLLPFVLKRIKKSGTDRGRIVLSGDSSENLLYAGHLFRYFLDREGIKSSGEIKTGGVINKEDRLILTYTSEFSLTAVISKLLEHSSNFMANQILIAAGAKAYGPPGTLEKGVLAAKMYAERVLKTDGIDIVEGSGIARTNKVTAKALYAALIKFQPYHRLLQKTDRTYFKTGTLHGVRTRAGYIENAHEELSVFIVLINTPGKSPEPVMDILQRELSQR